MQNDIPLINKIQSSCSRAPGIYGSEHYHHSVVLLLLTWVDGALHIVFQERSAHVRQPGEMCLPGGGFEPDIDKTVEDTALRETAEELGIPTHAIRVIGRLDTVIARMGALIDVVVGITDIHPSAFSPNAYEVARVFTLPVDWFLEHAPEQHQVMVQVHSARIHPETGEEELLLPAAALGLPEKYHRSWGNSLQPVIVYNTPEGVIWGITGGILKDFTDRIK